ncbi:DUF952 domain-containing protein [Rhizobium alvei]|uniref:DUF952 domain-containing protein n=1 Tax=Rhizobium alvei TaxID=1132659 RepID=A0ABT8YLP3_9HYPH|nr:DUF952 domain-containing protein [Rhizobium alvei]MDO6964602.1 DUF952 domain-containing protein [Rhizobium alvei]
MSNIVYKIVPADLWRKAEEDGSFRGASIDLTDGFIHLSTGAQAKKTAELYFAGQDDLLLVAIDGDRLGSALVYEPSRDGALFPHLYASLDPASVLWAHPLVLRADGGHDFPEDFA